MSRARQPVSGGTREGSAPAEKSTDLQRLTSRVQHRLNNPLAALLAETQLLGMDQTLGLEQQEAVERVVDLVRRVIALVRDLDAGPPDADPL